MVQGQAESQAAENPVRDAAADRRGPWLREIGILVAFLGGGIAATWPLASYLTGRLPASRDVAIYVWNLWWVAHQVIHLHNPWFTGYLAAPAGLQLGYHTLVPALGVLMLPVTLLFGPSVAYNLLVIALPGLACYVMYRTARLWLPTRAGAVAAGAFFGLSAMLTFQDWYHLNISYGTVFLPLTLLTAVKVRRQPTIGRAVILGVVIGGSVLVNPESSVMVLIVAGLALVPWLFSRAVLVRLRAVAVAGLTAVVVATPQLIAMIQQARAGEGATSQSLGYTSWVADAASLFAPSPRLSGYGLTALGDIYSTRARFETINTFGVVLSLLAVLGLIVSWRRRSAWLLALLWLGGAALALGPVLYVGNHLYLPWAQTWQGLRVSRAMPYTWFIRVPGLSVFREADRLSLIGLTGAALLAGAAVDWLQRRRAWPVILAVAALGGLEAGWPGHPPGLPVMATASPALDGPIAADHSGSIVVDVPFGLANLPGYGEEPDARAILLATEDGHPRAICYASWVPTGTIAAIESHQFYVRLNQAQHGYKVWPNQLPAAQADLARLHVGWVLVWTPDPGQALTRYLAATGFRFAYQADGVSVYRPT